MRYPHAERIPKPLRLAERVPFHSRKVEANNLNPRRCSFAKPGFFGLRVVYRPDEESKASPIDYLERWLLHNAFFADQVRFLGVVTTPDGNRLIIEQPAIAGIPATSEAQIRDFFIGNGWKPFTSDGETAFFDPENGLAISDTHRGNLILMPDGLLAPIDLRIQKLSGSILDIVKSLTAAP